MARAVAARDPTGHISVCRITAENSDQHLLYLEQFKVIVCCQHKSAIQNLDRHLRDKHGVSAVERTIITDKFRGLYARQPNEVILPRIPTQPIDALGVPLKGMQCNINNCEYITTSDVKFGRHCKAAHKILWKGEINNGFRRVRVQTLFRTGGLQKYFVVHDQEKDGDEHRISQSNDRKVKVAALLAGWSGVWGKHEEKMQVLEAEVVKTDKTGWWNRTGWTKHFAERNIIHLAHSTRLPDRDERILKQAARVVEVLVEQGVAGLSSLTRETRRWLRSARKEEADQRPLARLQNPESQARYASYVVMFVCHILRLIAHEQIRGIDDSGLVLDDDSSTGSDNDDDTDSSSSDGGNKGDDEESSSRFDGFVQMTRSKSDPLKDARKMFPWHGRQKELAKEFYASLELDDLTAQVAALSALMGSFIFQDTGNDPLSSGLIHFIALLGIDRETSRLRGPSKFSYIIAGMVYCVRIIGAEVLLPASKRQEQTNDDRDNFLQKRRDFLADGSFSPMSEMLSLLAYSKHIALAGGNSGNAFWSFDKKIFYLNGRPIVVGRFQQMMRDVITEVEDTFWNLLWITKRDERFVIKLENIVDDVNFTQRGSSFVQKPCNNLQNGLAWVLDRSMQTIEGQRLRLDQDMYDVKQIKRYVRRVRRWLELLLAAVHFSSGQPGRGTEITSMRRINGVLQDRNIFVVDGQVMTVIRYHKSQSQWDKPKIIPRFLPWRLGQIVVLYMTYLQPFYEYLSVNCLGCGFNDYVWADEHGPWTTDRLTRIIKRQTGRHLDTVLTTLDYRHVAVGIGRVMVSEGFGRGYEDEVGEVEEQEVDEDMEDALELQNARTTIAGMVSYSVRADVVKHLSVRSIDTFRPLSELWHKFLGLASRQHDAEASMNDVDWSIGKGCKRARDESTQQHEAVQPLVKAVNIPHQAQTSRTIYAALQRVLGRLDVAFKSPEQEQAVHAIVDKQTPLVVILPTGGGKSLLFMLPACLDDGGVTVVVVPYRALIANTIERIQAAGINCVEWKHGQVNPASIVVVSADLAGDFGFLRYTALLDSKKMLRRVVLDECHLIFTSSHWRPKLAGLKDLRVLSCPFVLLTATLPPSLEQDLSESMLVRCATYIRASTVRANIRYTVSYCKRGEEQEMALGMCKRQQRRLKNGLKGVVYCHGRAECEQMAEELGCGFYHAQAVDRAETIQRWVEVGGLIVATAALGTGVDFPGIVFILHVGMPWGMIDFAQESGRGGRGGELVDSVIVVEQGSVERRLAKSRGLIDVWAMGQFIEAEGCRRATMSGYLDGRRVECGEVESAGCDRCGEGVAEWRETNHRWEGEWERVEMMLDELREGCGICWVMEGGEGWRGHEADRCVRYIGQTKAELDRFRGMIRYSVDSHSCMKCRVSQVHCATGEDIEAACQWVGVVVPLLRAGVGLKEGVSIARSIGYTGEIEEGLGEYCRWLGQRHERRVWGEKISNGMAVVIELILYLTGGGDYM